MTYSIKINGADHKIDVDGDTPLLWVLRDTLGMTGTKFGCGIAACGACTVHLDGVAIRSCVTTVDSIGAADVTTIEGLSPDRGHKVQRAWIAEDVPQCGYCQSGMIMAAAVALEPRTPNRRMPRSTPRLPISAAAAPTTAFAPRSIARLQPEREDHHATDDDAARAKWTPAQSPPFP